MFQLLVGAEDSLISRGSIGAHYRNAWCDCNRHDGYFHAPAKVPTGRRAGIRLLTGRGRFPTLRVPHCGGVAQLVRALPCHGRGCGFESRRSRQHLLAFSDVLGFRGRFGDTFPHEKEIRSHARKPVVDQARERHREDLPLPRKVPFLTGC